MVVDHSVCVHADNTGCDKFSPSGHTCFAISGVLRPHHCWWAWKEKKNRDIPEITALTVKTAGNP